MSAFKFCLKLILVTGIIFIALIYLFFSYTPVTSIQFRGQIITITRNQFGIPFIKAPSRPSLYYAWAYAMAEDRLFQFNFRQLAAHGRLSEYLGEKTLIIDRQMRELNFRYWGQQTARKNQRQNITFYKDMEAFAQGINDYVASLPTMPIDFHLSGIKWQNWTISTIYTLQKLVQWSMCLMAIEEYLKSSMLKYYTEEQINLIFVNNRDNWVGSKDPKSIISKNQVPEHMQADRNNQQRAFFRQFSPKQVKDLIDTGLLQYLSSGFGGGSNAWVISGNYTQSGAPLLANDVHLQTSIPSQWYQIFYEYSNNNRTHWMKGVTVPGTVSSFGKSQYVTIGVTISNVDTIDFYKQTIREDKKYLINGEWRPLKERKEVIKVKKNGQIEEQVYSVYETFRGPLIHYVSNPTGLYEVRQNISLVWVGFHNEFRSIMMNTYFPEAYTHQQVSYLATIQTQFQFNLNLVYITKDNHIGFQLMGRNPLRRNISSGQYVKDGSTTQHDWIGFLAAEDRINCQDPEKGFIIMANNKLTEDDYMNGYHQFMIYTARGDRLHEKIEKKIAEGTKFTVQDMVNMQLDTVDLYCKGILPLIIDLISQARELLGNFDCNFTGDSYQASIYEVFFYQLAKIIKPQNDHNINFLAHHNFYQYMYGHIRKVGLGNSSNSTLVSAWENMKKNLTGFFNSNDPKTWVWSKYHRDVTNHVPFGATPLKRVYNRQFGGFGNMHTPNVGRMNKIGQGGFQTTHRATYRTIFGYGQDEEWWLVDTGSSEKFYSYHYDDQWKLLQEGKYIRPTWDTPRPTDL